MIFNHPIVSNLFHRLNRNRTKYCANTQWCKRNHNPFYRDWKIICHCIVLSSVFIANQTTNVCKKVMELQCWKRSTQTHLHKSLVFTFNVCSRANCFIDTDGFFSAPISIHRNVFTMVTLVLTKMHESKISKFSRGMKSSNKCYLPFWLCIETENYKSPKSQ